MRNEHKIFFLTFADSRLACKDIIKKQAEKSGYFDTIYAFDEDDLESWYRDKFAERLVLGSRGYGYWQWKSYLVRRVMDRMDEGDYLVYADAGCTINPDGGDRLKEYFDFVDNNGCGILGFQEEGIEAEWTKGDVFDFFGVMGDEEYRTHGQVAATTFIIRKKWKSHQFVDEWYYICHNYYELITDAPSSIPNYKEFVENRNDQSVFSIMALKYGIAVVPVTEIFSETNYESMKKYPIWATRRKPKKHSFLWKQYHRFLSFFQS